MELNKQLCASVLGISIVVFHVTFSFYLWFSFYPNFNLGGDLTVAELSTPLSATFALGVIKWVIDTQGKITSEETVGLTFIVLLSFISIALFLALAYGPYKYTVPGSGMEPKALNSYFLFVESILGAMFGLFFSDMFGRHLTSTGPGDPRG